MPNGQDVRSRTSRFLSQPPNGLPVEAGGEDGTLAARGPGAKKASRFVVFLPEHERQALALTEQFMNIANERLGPEGLEAVLDAAEKAAADRNSELVKHALMVFITHYPRGRTLPIPSLDSRAPNWVIPSQAAGPGLLGALGNEAKLDYFREDTAVNDHHERWHIVYPKDGHPDPAKPSRRISKDRQGELFWYMHQQMLARYDTERLALGLPIVQPFDNYQAAIIEGYDSNIPGFSDRPANQRLKDINGYTLSDHEKVRDRLRQTVQTGVLKRADGTSVQITPPLLGSTIEASQGSADIRTYGQLHNMGHALIAAVPNPDVQGMMSLTSTAVRDPIFFRWHRHVDDIFIEWQNKLPAQDFVAGATEVRLRHSLNGSRPAHASPDILIASAKSLPKLSDRAFDGQAYGDATFGGAAWDKPVASLAGLTNELETSLGNEQVKVPGGGTVSKPYLDHEEFCFFIRMENAAADARKVTVRVFLAASALADNRRMWIEMDKFTHELKAGERSVVYRPARLSAVVRKPARRPKEPVPRRPGGPEDASYCDCGWPYHLLLPRGTPEGFLCRLCVALTDFENDLVGADKKCGSMSFCGAKDALYPDRRAMGYPFDRPFATTIDAAITSVDHIASRSLTIRFTG